MKIVYRIQILSTQVCELLSADLDDFIGDDLIESWYMVDTTNKDQGIEYFVYHAVVNNEVAADVANMLHYNTVIGNFEEDVLQHIVKTVLTVNLKIENSPPEIQAGLEFVSDFTNLLSTRMALTHDLQAQRIQKLETAMEDLIKLNQIMDKQVAGWAILNQQKKDRVDMLYEAVMLLAELNGQEEDIEECFEQTVIVQ